MIAFARMLSRLFVLVLIASAAMPVRAQQLLRWGGDAEGGAPFVEADPTDPAKLVGFDVEIAELIARQLGEPRSFSRFSSPRSISPRSAATSTSA